MNSNAQELEAILFPDHCPSCHSEWEDGYGYDEEPCCSKAKSNIHDAVKEWADKQANAREVKARIEEIEDIDQSRAIEADDEFGTFCQSCHMTLESPEDSCGCNHLYQQRKGRLAELREQLTTNKPNGRES